MEFVRIRRRERDSMLRFQKDGKMIDVCSELQASVFRKNGWVRVEPVNGCAEIICEPEATEAPEQTKESEVTETPEQTKESETADTKGTLMAGPEPEKQPVKRGRKPATPK